MWDREELGIHRRGFCALKVPQHDRSRTVEWVAAAVCCALDV